MNKKFMLRTAGWCTVALGLYLVHKGTDSESEQFTKNFTTKDDIIDVDFTIIEE